MKLIKYQVCKGVLHCETGLRIGAGKDAIEVSGSDNPILRHPLTDLPYVPGSSLKGKMRSQLELRDRRVTQNGGPCDCGQCAICRTFGCAKAKNSREPARILVRDCALTDDSQRKLEQAQADRGLFFAEEKSEVVIDRNTGKAAGAGPRPMERVPAGIEFQFEIVLRIFEGDDEAALRKMVEDGLDLVEQDALGGSGSRGYGKVRFLNRTWSVQEV